MKVKLSDINKVRVKGRTYYYFGRGKGAVRLPDDPNSPEFLAMVADLADPKNRRPADTVATLADTYSGSPEFDNLAHETRRVYLGILKRIQSHKIGTMPLEAADDPRSRRHFMRWRNEMRSTPRRADLSMAVLKRLFSFGIDQGLMSYNPVSAVGRLSKGTRAEIVWTDDQIDLALGGFPTILAQAVALALWTGQRKADILGLRWKDIDGEYIRITQSKTGAKVSIYLTHRLRSILDAIEKVGPLVLTNSLGRPWTSSGFDSSWKKAMASAAITGVTFNDLRGTAENRLRESGCTEAECYSITGRQMHGSAKAYYNRSDVLSRIAMQKYEEHFGNKNCKTLAKLPRNRKAKRP